MTTKMWDRQKHLFIFFIVLWVAGFLILESQFQTIYWREEYFYISSSIQDLDGFSLSIGDALKKCSGKITGAKKKDQPRKNMVEKKIKNMFS